ncbi:hypothetical protein [Devosia chinhatensis]|uniref:Uncharacterized protein n=1 Tax=Devosia chinhatensis TaxID=429727 RepID=A0A0F5FGH9_9HYPH|nr:hypothetical protein [Devosia chinhatensis]KKB08009.1 hypothetical protein VE26_15595 [Devosia chinhatensis]
MRRAGIAFAVLFAASLPAGAFDAQSRAIVGHFKPGKLLPIADVATLMLGAERWCYNQREGNCAWSDIYLAIDGDAVSYELSNAWDDAVTISFIGKGNLRDGRYICDIGHDWVPSVRAEDRATGAAITGRALAALKVEIAGVIDTSGSAECFDYLYRGHDEAAETITLTQRQYANGTEYRPEFDAEVTLYFDGEAAGRLGLY